MTCPSKPSSGSIEHGVVGYVFKNKSFGFLAISKNNPNGPKGMEPAPTLRFVKEVSEASIYATPTEALDQLQGYVRLSGGHWCSHLTLQVVEEMKTVSTMLSARLLA